MRKYEFDYNIYPDNSPQKFKEACSYIEKANPDFNKGKLLIDVDGSTIQIYNSDNKEIVVYDDYDVGAVYALSDVPLNDTILFKQR